MFAVRGFADGDYFCFFLSVFLLDRKTTMATMREGDGVRERGWDRTKTEKIKNT